MAHRPQSYFDDPRAPPPEQDSTDPNPPRPPSNEYNDGPLLDGYPSPPPPEAVPNKPAPVYVPPDPYPFSPHSQSYVSGSPVFGDGDRPVFGDPDMWSSPNPRPENNIGWFWIGVVFGLFMNVFSLFCAPCLPDAGKRRKQYIYGCALGVVGNVVLIFVIVLWPRGGSA